MNKKIISAVIMAITVLSTAASAEYNKYNEEDYVNLSNKTIGEIAQEMEMSYDDLKKEYELPEDMPEDTNETAAFYHLTTKNLAKLYGEDLDTLLAEMKEAAGGEGDFTADTLYGEAENKILLKNYISDMDEEEFKQMYSLDESITGDTLFAEVRIPLYRTILAQSEQLSYFDKDALLVMLNGKYVDFDVAPAIVNDRTMVPLRGIFEKLGASVNWDGDNKTVFVNKGDKIIILQIGQNNMFVNSDKLELDAAAEIVDGRTLVPLRAIAEALDTEVFYNEKTKTVVIH